MEYLLHLVLIVVLLVSIVYVCVLFTNSVENFGEEYKLQDGAVGGILAAIGTALPETIVPLVAILGTMLAGEEISVGEDIALGAVLGSPFLLSTVAFFITGLSVLVCSAIKKRSCIMCANPITLLRDIKYFIFSYSLAVLCAFIPIKTIKIFVACALILYYLVYVLRTLKKDFGCNCDNSEVSELLFAKLLFFKKVNKKVLIWWQVFLSFLALIFLSDYFVSEIKFFAELLKIHPMIMSLLLAPIATELPECFNSALWIGSSRDSLSISNITGALVFQSCIPTAIGITLTPWVFNTPALLSVVLVYCSLFTIYLYSIKNKGMLNYKILIFCGVFYLIYIAYVLKMLI